ncbi:hypothetical protein J2X46_000426 [Nocardioides sp. BE266]|uniref:LpqB family beta-propeller domain-containing protein n=1 Tax=Nocardioides sp. BE266 TaxID=2817725 RepID=UPI002857B2E6|nr:LpqB family beta-propeller domain-containing protein [Nocardioides sp. BE266]MDR7251454.1 hypothetical protein [Nocardioides sp. BE266]
MIARARLARAFVSAAACTLLAGCVQMPSEGPVVEPKASTEVDELPGFAFDPRPPQAGQSPEEVVAGFLEAMRATPVSNTVARQFLSTSAAETWVPEQQIITYNELGTASGNTSVQIPMTDVNLYDARGAWERTQVSRTLSLGLVEEDGEWRIDEVPDALIVPDSWFGDWYERVSLYFFDPTAEVLVPEPVFVPRGDQFASSLVRGLLMPPSDDDADVVRTFFPAGARALSVPISSGGIAEVALSGDPGAVDQDTADRMLAQLAWTLKQDDRINAVRLSIGGQAVGFQDGSSLVNVGVGSLYDPNGAGSSSELFALDRGRVVSGAMGAFQETLGPFGQQDLGIRSIGVSLDGSRVAAVSGTGTGMSIAPTEAPDGEATPVVSDAVDLAAPSWDYRGRTWVLDRGAGSARVILVVDGVARDVVVPGLTGRTVTKLLVSRDGSRLVAVVRGPKVDRVVVSRVRHDAAGTVVGFTPLQTLPVPAEGSPRIRDIGWRSPTSVSVLSDLTDESSQVRTLSVDGAPGELSSGGTIRLRGRSRVLVSSPVDLAEMYGLAGRKVIDLTRLERSVSDLPQGLTSLTYTG